MTFPSKVRSPAGLAAILCSLFAVVPASADELGLRSGFETDISIGMTNGTAFEHVFNFDGSNLSRLDWQYENNAMLMGGVSYRLFDWLSVGARGRLALSDESNMDDFDWGIAFCPGGFCHSISDKTYLTSSYAVDLHADASLWDIGFGTFGVTGGYMWDTSAWEAWGGIANYASFTHELGISYQQWWEAPYVGVTLEGGVDRFTWSGRLYGTPFAMGNAEDTHHLRDLLFTEEYQSSSMYGISFALGFVVTDNVKFKFGYDWQEWLLAEGSTWVTDQATGEVIYEPLNSGGASSSTETISAGFNYSF